MPVPVQIVSGFLGAGKTTAIRARLAAARGRRVAVIVNDFGEAGFDEAALAEGEPFRITNIPGGCVCCTAPEGFAAALGAVLDGDPELLLIEPTGLARPQDLVDSIRRSPHAQRLALAPLLVLIDPHQLARLDVQRDHAGLSLLREQAEAADVLVANRIDLCSASELEGLRAFAASIWPAPLALYETRHGELPDDAFEWPEGEGRRARVHRERDGVHAHATSTAGYHVRSWQWPPHALFSRERLRAALEKARGEAGLERVKGVFHTREGVCLLELAGGALHERPSSFRRDSRADAIASHSGTPALDALGTDLEAARLSESERSLDSERIELVLPDGRRHSLDRAQLCALPDPVPDVSTLFPKRAGSAARLARLFDALDVPKDGVGVVVAGDGFASEPVDIAVLRHGVLLHTRADAPLPADQGGPFRLLIPQPAAAPPVSCANVKGVTQIVIRPR
jgi:G3E family GTPase